jgi:hypothetical protein
VHQLDRDQASHFAALALSALHREYPNKLSYVLTSDADVLPPRRLTPAFYGCFDWHSAVHGHWALARLVRLCPGAAFEQDATRALDTSLTDANLAGELRYLHTPGREGFELPYGMAWLLTLARELCEWDDPRAHRWQGVLRPLEQLAAERMLRWATQLPFAVRTGEHTQSAFGLAMFLDWARTRDERATADAIALCARKLYASDRDGPIHLEPSGYDFLSPCLSEADLMRRLLEPADLAGWLTRFLPGLAAPSLPLAVSCPDPADPKLSHLDGLNLSRAWMLEAIASALPETDARRKRLLGSAAQHAARGLAAVTGDHYAGRHWQGSFAVYLLTRRGL